MELDRFLNGLSVDVRELTACQIPAMAQLQFTAREAVTLHYVIAGEGLAHIGDDSPIAVRPESIVVVPARLQQRWSCGVATDSRVGSTASCAPLESGFALSPSTAAGAALSIVRADVALSNGGVAGLTHHLRRVIVESVAQTAGTRALLTMAIEEFARPLLGSRIVSQSLMRAFIVKLLRQHFNGGNHASSLFTMMSDPRLARALTAVLERPHDNHSVSSLATIAGMSRTMFASRFREVYGQSPNEFIQGFRLKFAAHLLQTTNLPIKAVATAIGYSSRSYFSRAFRAAYDIDPSAYRLTAGLPDETTFRSS